jgi:hypothetical protein
MTDGAYLKLFRLPSFRFMGKIISIFSEYCSAPLAMLWSTGRTQRNYRGVFFGGELKNVSTGEFKTG